LLTLGGWPGMGAGVGGGGPWVIGGVRFAGEEG